MLRRMVPTADGVLTQLRRGVLEFCVLAYLKPQAAYGLEIATGLSQHELLFTSEGTLYPLLARLRKHGWVETTWRESRSGPPRRYYSLTSDGSAALEAFTELWKPFSHGVDKVVGAEQ
jgi:PadR family transcriptional regulator, regulatory protein PadR